MGSIAAAIHDCLVYLLSKAYLCTLYVVFATSTVSLMNSPRARLFRTFDPHQQIKMALIWPIILPFVIYSMFADWKGPLDE